MLISVKHLTRYRYDAPVNYTIQSVRLTPAAFAGQRVLDWRVRVSACERPLQFTDAFGNIEAVGGGLDVNNDVKLDILLASKDGESARRMQMALDRGLKLALVGLSLLGEERKELNLLLDVVKSIKVSANGKVVRVSGRLTQDVIEDFFKKDG